MIPKLALFSFLVLILTALTPVGLTARPDGDSKRVGSIAGRILDGDTGRPLVAVTVELLENHRIAVSDTMGCFVFDGIPPGDYSLSFRLVGYHSLVRTGVTVASKDTAELTITLLVKEMAVDPIVVTASFLPRAGGHTPGLVLLTSDVIERTPGTGGDVSRVMAALPGVSRFDDHYNGLMVRGGNPMENGSFIDNVEVPNINHFPSQASSGGAFGLLPADMIRQVCLYTGGFPASFGDRLSSIVDISLRDGNRDRFGGRANVGVIGAEATVEGPLGGGRGSWLLSARRGFLDLVLDVMDADVAPRFSDVQGKITLDAAPHSKLTALALFGTGDVAYSREEARRAGLEFFGSVDYAEGTLGANWRYLWNQAGFTNTALSYSRAKYRFNNADTKTNYQVHVNDSEERIFRLRTVNHYRPSGTLGLEFGLDATHTLVTYDYEFEVYIDQFGGNSPHLDVHEDDGVTKAGVFSTLIVQPVNPLAISVGARLDYHSISGLTHASPRLAVTYALGGQLSLTAAVGTYVQGLPPSIISQHHSNTRLREPRAFHALLGLSGRLTNNLRVTLELYSKSYHDAPMDPGQPTVFVLDEVVYLYGFFLAHRPLVDAGEAYSRGVEVSVDGHISDHTYGTVNATFFRSRYRGLDAIWRNRISDNRLLINVAASHLINGKWEFSARWSYAGGAPFSPADSAASETHNGYVFDAARVNTIRLPAYHSLNIHVKRHFKWGASRLTAYVGVWNAYDRANVAGYSWDDDRHRSEPIEQLGLLPVFGLEYRF